MVGKCGAKWKGEGMAGGMKGAESDWEWRAKETETKRKSTEVTASLAARPSLLLLSDNHRPRGRSFIRALSPVNPSPLLL